MIPRERKKNNQYVSLLSLGSVLTIYSQYVNIYKKHMYQIFIREVLFIMFMYAYTRAAEVLLKKPIRLWGLSLLMVVVTVIGCVVTAPLPFLSIAVGYLFTCGTVKLYMDGLKGKEVNSKQLFYAFNKNCVKTAGALAWQNLWTVIWAFVPVYGTIKAYSYRFVPYITVSHPEISAFDALKISMKMTNGKKLQMWLADLIFVAAPMIASFILGLLGSIKFVGDVFNLINILLAVAIALFGTIFSGLYQASFFNEDEVAQYIEAPEAVAAE